MAIVKMKRLRLIAMRQDREELLKKLQRMGCVEISEPSADLSDPEFSMLVQPDFQELSAAKERYTVSLQALEILKKYVPEKGGMFSARPVISEQELFDDDVSGKALETAQQVVEAERQIQAMHAGNARIATQQAALAPWLDIDIPLETDATYKTGILFGTVPSAYPLEEVEGALRAETELVEVIQASRDPELRYLVLICHKEVLELVQEVLRGFSWNKANLREWKGTAAENDRTLAQKIKQTEQSIDEMKQQVTELAGQRESIRRLADRSNQEISREEARGRMLDTREAFWLEGWLPAEKCGALEKLLESYSAAWETADPLPEEVETVPVKLKNNILTKPLNMVTEMYSLPAYDGVDPNPLMAPFFILFYGIMMADMGYGLVMMAASLIIMKKARPKKGMYNFFALLGLCGASTFIVGILTGGFFGDFIPQIVKVINPESTFEWFWKPLFTPLDDTLMILVGAMALGFVQVIAGMVINLVKQAKDGKALDGILDNVPWWMVFAGIAVGALTGNWYLAIAGVVALILTQGRSSKGIFGKLFGGISSLYDITGYFGDILSYSRLMALMLAGSVIAQVFNTLGAIPGNVVVFIIISMIGNALNFALNLLGCYVHDLRLQCLEFFGKFYKDGGRPFKPLELDTKYVDILAK